MRSAHFDYAQDFDGELSRIGKRGFTLVELLVVISIIAILSVIGITIFSSAQKTARDAKRRTDLHAIALAMEQYKIEHNTYTPSTVFPCTLAWASSFSHHTFGVYNDRSSSANCTSSASFKTALGSYFSGKIPQDPNCKDSTSCNGGTATWDDYYLTVPDGAASFTLSARFETAPSSAMTGCMASPYNYCVHSQQ